MLVCKHGKEMETGKKIERKERSLRKRMKTSRKLKPINGKNRCKERIKNQMKS